MTASVSIFEKSRVPIYLQVARLARRKIERGEWALGAQIPTLQALSREYPVARSTLREALGQLEQEGLIQRSRGRGTFVAKDISGERWFRLPLVWDELLASVADLDVRPIAIGQRRKALPGEVTAEIVGGTLAPTYQHMRRVHLRERLPYCLIDLYIDQSLYERSPARFRKLAVLTTLARMDDVSIARAYQTLRITTTDEVTAAHLDIGVGEPIVDVIRILEDATTRVVYCAHIRYPAGLVRIEVDLLARPAAASRRKVRA